ncbi:MFS transporter, partial [Asanoa iriomotensis]
TSSQAAYWHTAASRTPPPPSRAERAEARAAAERAAAERQAQRAAESERRRWGGRPPSARLRELTGNVKNVARAHRDLLDQLAALPPATQREIANWLARKAFAHAGMTDDPKAAAALDALDNGAPLPPPFTDMQSAFAYLHPKPSSLTIAIVATHKEPHRQYPIHRPSFAVPALFGATESDPLQAVVEAFTHAEATFDDRRGRAHRGAACPLLRLTSSVHIDGYSTTLLPVRAYRELFAVPEVRPLVVSAVATRIAAPMLTLALFLAVVAAGRSYAAAGLVLTGFAAALALSVPVSARLVDRLAPRRILLGCLAGHLTAYAIMIFALAQGLSTGVLVGCAVALGVSTPPAGPVVRATWPAFVPRQRLQTAFALDAVVNEAMYVTGPLVVSLLLLFTDPIVVTGVAGLAMLVGILLLVSAPSVRRREASDDAERRNYLGPLESGQVRLLLAVIVCDAFAFGAVVVAAPAAAAEADSPGAAGLLIGAVSLGTVVSALVYGTRPPATSLARQMFLFHAATALVLAGVSRAPTLLLLGCALLALGLVGGPRDTLHQLALGDAAPERYRTEAFAWMGSSMWAGYALGSGAAGQLISLVGDDVDAAFFAAGGVTALAALLSLLVRGQR